MTNTYWAVYKSLERELVCLSEHIYIDDTQLGVYSLKILELLLRCAVEIESISKELYKNLGGILPTDRDIFFDTDCLALLESKWKLSKKVIIASHINFHFVKDENKILKPLHNAHIRGKADWKKAYQAVKHDRANSLQKANLKHLIRAMAALFVLNLYYKDEVYTLDKNQKTIPSNMGSEIFDIKIHKYGGYDGKNNYLKEADFQECVYLTKRTDDSQKLWIEAIEKSDIEFQKLLLGHPKFKQALQENPNFIAEYSGKNLAWDLLGQEEYIKIVSKATHFISDAAKKNEDEAVLNKGQV